MTDSAKDQRTVWVKVWQDTVWERAAGGCWLPLEPRSSAPLLVLSAWNPGSTRLPTAVNQARDAVLLAELQALGLVARRVRGRSGDGSWHEDGWQVAHEITRSLALLRRYGQLAGLLTDADGQCYLWSESAPAR